MDQNQGTIAAAAPAVKSGGKNIGKQLIGVVLAGGLLWLSFRGINFAEVLASMRTADPVWLGALVGSVIVSHLLRSARWLILLRPLSDHRVSLFNSFCAVMYGYAINIPIPRGGEVARVVSISKSEKLPWAGVASTLLVDRLLDFAMLVGAIGLTLAILPPSIKEHAGFLVPAGVIICAATVLGLVLLPRTADIISWVLQVPPVRERLPQKWAGVAKSLAEQVELGTRALSNPLALPGIAVLSVAMWLCYFANLYVMIPAFHLQGMLDLVRTVIVWTVSSVSVIAPTPGCVGTFHIATSKALSAIGGVDPTTALALVTLMHAISFVAVPCLLAAVCFVVQNARQNKVSDGA